MKWLRAAEVLLVLMMTVAIGVVLRDVHLNSGAVLDATKQLATTVQKTNKILDTVNENAISINALVTNLNTRATFTSQLLNANLLHMDIVMGRIEEASRDQAAITRKTNAVLDDTDKLIQTATASTAKLQPVLEDADATVKGLNALLASKDTSETLHNIDLSSQELVKVGKAAVATLDGAASTMQHVDNISANIDKKVDLAMHPKKLALSILGQLLKWAANIKTII